MDSYLHLLSLSTKFYKRYPLQITLLVITGLGASFFEGLTMALIFPLLDSGTTVNASTPAISIIIKFFQNINMENRMRLIGILLLSITAVKGTLLYYNNVLTARLSVEAIKKFRHRCFDQLLNLSTAYLNTKRGSDLLTMTSDYTKWVGSLVSVISPIITKIFTTIVLIIMLFFLSWQLALLGLLLVALASLTLHSAIKNAEVSNKRSNESLLKFNHHLLATINGMKIVRVFNNEEMMKKELKTHVATQAEANYQNNKANGSINPIFETTSIAALAIIILFYSAIFGSNADTSLPVLLAFIIILFRLIIPIASLNQSRAQVASLLPSLSGLESFLKKGDKTYIPDGTKDYVGLMHGITFNNIYFSYDKNEKNVLNNISFSIKKGEKVAIVGPSGSGKSTITEMLLRFYDPNEGQVLIDGIDLKNLKLTHWRKKLGIVTQDTFLFNNTVKANICFGDQTADMEKITRAAKLAHAHDFIIELPQGYDTILGDRGIRLSGGQRQRIAIARAILTEPELLIFDEATSSLDTEAEKQVQHALNEVSENRTTITIAHRLSTITSADKIIVLEKGKITEMGSHDELCKKGGLYYRLVNVSTNTI